MLAPSPQITQEFQEFLDVLGANLISVKKRIVELEGEIKTNKAAYTTAMVTAVLEGILAGILTAAWITLLIKGVGAAWAPGLLIAGIALLGMLIQHSVEADRLSVYVHTCLCWPVLKIHAA